MNPKIAQIAEKLKQLYQNVDTILLFGSALDASWTENSDVDVFLIDDSFPTSREDLEIDGVKIELQKDNFKTLETDIKSESGRLLNRNLSTMIATGLPLKSASPTKLQALKTLSEQTLASKSNYTTEDVEMWQYSIQDYLAKAAKDLERNDPVAFYLDAHYVIQNALELSLAIHGAYLPQPKHLATLLAKIDPALLQALKTFALAPNLPSRLSALQSLSKSPQNVL